MSVPRHRMTGGQGQTPEFLVHDFGGMHNNPARQDIEDQDFWWSENVIPVAPGFMPVTNALSNIATLGTETTNPIYTMMFTGTVISPFGVRPAVLMFAVFSSGNGYVINTSGAAITSLAGFSTGGGVYATQYFASNGNIGILIIDPTLGYADFGITTPASFTKNNNTVNGATNTSKTSVAGGTQLKQILAVSGTGAVFQVNYQVISVTINAAGTGYVVGDSLTLTDGSPITAANIIVTAVGGGGAITGISLPSGGSYPGPTSAVLTATGPTGNTVSGGTGTTATFHVTIQAFQFTVTTQGRNYANTDTVTDETAVPVVTDAWKLQVSGIIAGNAIATYAGRVWIASQRTVFVSDINQYLAFGGAGFTFTISDSYLHNIITCLFSVNNYLYIFGDNSIDVVSNLTVSPTTGLSSFTRINVTTAVGTSAPSSVFGYYRSLVFLHPTGIYLLSGATPEKISERISGVVRLFNNITATNAAGAAIQLQGELCIAMQVFFNDTFTGAGNRAVVLIFTRNKWTAHSFGSGANTVVNLNFASIPFGTAYPQTAFVMTGTGGTNPTFSQVFGNAALSAWNVKTRFFDGQARMREKQPLNAALAAILGGGASSGATFTIDTENGSSGSVAFPVVGTPTGYYLMVEQSNMALAGGPAQFLGMTVNGTGNNLSNVALIALKGQTSRDILS